MGIRRVTTSTPSERIARAGVEVVTRRIPMCHTHPTFDGEGGLITVGGCGSTIRTSTGRGAGNREGGKGWAADEGGGDVIADHSPLTRIRKPGECHGSSDLRIGGPGGSAIG